MSSSDTFEVIDINGDTMRTTPVNTPNSSTPSPSSTSTPSSAPERPVARHRYNLRRVIKKPLRYGDNNILEQHIVYDRHNIRKINRDFRKCTVYYNPTTGGNTIYGFTRGKEYFTTRGANYVILNEIECDSDDEDITEIIPGSLKGFTIYPYGRGFLMYPPTKNHPDIGTKYYHEAWWMSSKNGWFLRPKFFTRMTDRGAVLKHPQIY